MDPAWKNVALLVVDIDGVLTDAKVHWGGVVGWTQTFSVRDGEAILRLVAVGVPVVPLSRNRTECARTRMQGLGLPTTWVGVDDKVDAFETLRAAYALPNQRIAYIGDGVEDVPMLRIVGVPCSVADANPEARAAATYVTRAVGGAHAVEEIIDLILKARGWRT